MGELIEILQLEYLCKWYTNRSDLYHSALFQAAFNPGLHWCYTYDDSYVKFVMYLKAPTTYE